MSKHNGWILSNFDWGFCVIPTYPSMWLRERGKAHVFRTRREAYRASRRWATGLVYILREKAAP